MTSDSYVSQFSELSHLLFNFVGPITTSVSRSISFTRRLINRTTSVNFHAWTSHPRLCRIWTFVAYRITTGPISYINSLCLRACYHQVCAYFPVFHENKIFCALWASGHGSLCNVSASFGVSQANARTCFLSLFSP